MSRDTTAVVLAVPTPEPLWKMSGAALLIGVPHELKGRPAALEPHVPVDTRGRPLQARVDALHEQ